MTDDLKDAVSPIEDILEDARNGRMYILVDAEDRENEGDLIIPAQFATPEQVNFMAKFGRGLICLAMTADRARALDLDMMARENRESMGTAFTVSIEAKDGVTTGISAQDRARTVAVAIDPTKGPEDIVSPGHIFPLVAKDGGTLVRAGHTEASVDISRLAGLNPAGVICEIMNDDGTMARLPELAAFAQLHNMKIGTIADLIAYRQREDRFLERRIETAFKSRYGGDFRVIVFRNNLDGGEHVALVKGDVDPMQLTLVRVHRVDFLADILGQAAGREEMVKDALNCLSDADEAGVAVFVRMGETDEIAKQLGARPAVVADAAGPLREYGVGAQILKDIGVGRMLILTDNEPAQLPGLDGHGLTVEGWRPIHGDAP